MNSSLFSIDDLLNSAHSGLSVTDTDNAEAVADILDKYGLRWDVVKKPLHHEDGTPTDFYGIVRKDTNKTFATCKDTYVPFQNSELAEMLIRIAEKTGYNIHSGGSFNGGAKVYVQLNTGNEIKNLGKNLTTVRGYLTGINSHDGTSAAKWGGANLTICCSNTFAMAAKRLQESARHTKDLHRKVEESIRQITGIVAAEKALFDSFIQLADEPVKKQHIAEIVRNITKVDISLNAADAKKEYSTQAINRSQELLTSIGKEMKTKGETLWGLLSGVTHYTSHVMPIPKRDNARLESKYTGSALTIDNEAYETIMAYAGN